MNKDAIWASEEAIVHEWGPILFQIAGLEQNDLSIFFILNHEDKT